MMILCRLCVYGCVRRFLIATMLPASSTELDHYRVRMLLPSDKWWRPLSELCALHPQAHRRLAVEDLLPVEVELDAPLLHGGCPDDYLLGALVEDNELVGKASL